MADSRTRYRSSTRGSRTSRSQPRKPPVSYPASGGPQPAAPAPFNPAAAAFTGDAPRVDVITGKPIKLTPWWEKKNASPPRVVPRATDQANALTPKSASGGGGYSSAYGTWGALPKETQGAVQSQYGKGGFEGISQMPGWYDMPEYQRRQILEGVRG